MLRVQHYLLKQDLWSSYCQLSTALGTGHRTVHEAYFLRLGAQLLILEVNNWANSYIIVISPLLGHDKAQVGKTIGEPNPESWGYREIFFFIYFY